MKVARGTKRKLMRESKRAQAEREREVQQWNAETVRLANLTIDVDTTWLGAVGWLFVRSRCKGKFLSHQRQLAMGAVICAAAQARGWQVKQRIVTNGKVKRVQLFFVRSAYNLVSVLDNDSAAQ